MWIAKKKQTIKRGSLHIVVQPGDRVDEAEHWPNRALWVRQGYIAEVSNPKPEPKSERDEKPLVEVITPKLQTFLENEKKIKITAVVEDAEEKDSEDSPDDDDTNPRFKIADTNKRRPARRRKT